jgi:glycosyltransferase involved in cell wall biosynthesis
MTRRWHLLSGEYAPSTGGIAQFTRALARALASCEMDVHVWVPRGGDATDGVRVHALPDRFGARSRRALEPVFAGAQSDVVLVQYAPNAFGWKGANLPFCLWLRARRHDADIRVVFHEPFFYFGWQSPQRNALAAVQRLMAATLLSSARAAYVSSESWLPLLKRYAHRRASVSWRTLPITIGDVTPPLAADVRRVRGSLGGPGPIVGHLSAYAGELRAPLRAAIGAILRRTPEVNVLCIGRGSHAFVAGFRDPRVRATGELAGPEIAAHLAACDLVVAPFVEGVTTRRTSVLTALAAGAAVIATEGRYTEDVWRDSRAVRLVPAGDPPAMAAACQQLLASPAERRLLAERGLALYAARFSPATLLDALEIERVVETAAYRSGR